MGDRNSPDRTPRVLLARLLQTFDEQDWDELADLYHPDALLRTDATGEEPVTPPEMIARLQVVSDDGVHDTQITNVTDLDETACLASGRIRHRTPGGGIADSERHWLYVFKDGLLWRGSSHRSRAGAMKAYSEARDG